MKTLIATAGLAAALGVGGGLLLAAVGGDDPILAATAVDYRRCPGDDAPSGSLHRGDRVFAVATDASGTWLAVRSPAADSEIVWIEAPYLIADGTTDALPLASCPSPQVLETTTTTTSVVDSTTSTTVIDATTTTLDSTPPGISGIVAEPDEIYEEYPAGTSLCIDQTTSSIQITTTGGAVSVAAGFTVLGETTATSATVSGSTWTAVLGPYPFGDLPVPAEGADITVMVTAADAAGNEATASITVHLHSAAECLG